MFETVLGPPAADSLSALTICWSIWGASFTRHLEWLFLGFSSISYASCEQRRACPFFNRAFVSQLEARRTIALPIVCVVVTVIGAE